MKADIHRFLVYGTGAFAERYFESLTYILNNFPMDLVGFVDSGRAVCDFHGYHIYNVSDIQCLEYDYIYIFAYKDSYAQIYDDLTLKWKISPSIIGDLGDLVRFAQGLFRSRKGIQSRPAMVYDCFTFFNEFEILQMRLEMLYPLVDRFVLVEMDRDHHGKIKPCYFRKREKEFEKYLEKIIYVKPNHLTKWEDSECWNWTLEHFQRSCISMGLSEAQPEDIIMVSDCDEFPNPLIIEELKTDVGTPAKSVNRKMLDITSVALKQEYYYYFFNCHSRYRRNTTTVTKYKNMIEPQLIRDVMDFLPYIDNGGWHLTYFGGIDRICKKISSIVEGTTVDESIVKERVLHGKDIFGRVGAEYELEFVPKDEIDIPEVDKWIERYPKFYLNKLSDMKV